MDTIVAPHGEVEGIALLVGIEDGFSHVAVVEEHGGFSLNKVQLVPAGGISHEESALVNLGNTLVSIGGG